MTMQQQEHGTNRAVAGLGRRPAAGPPGFRIDAERVTRRVGGRGRTAVTVLDDVSLEVGAGQLVAIVGPSGAGKTMLLEALAGVAPIVSGTVRYDGADVSAGSKRFRGAIGFVPQDDIIHADLPLRQTLRYAARLRLPSSVSATQIEAVVRAALDTVGLAEQADVRVGSLSGGQRKRASIAVELLTEPRAFFLDEPTSSLDPAASGQLLGHLRRVADTSATVVFTTHSVDDLALCDRVVFMARGGHIGFVGTVDEALTSFAVGSLAELYGRLANGDTAAGASGVLEAAPTPKSRTPQSSRRPVAGGFRQWRVLTGRTFETLVRNRLTLAILLASPALVLGMFAVLFRPGAFDLAHPNPSSMVMIGFWVVFAAFFFGITYGLLQICTEFTIVRRERLVGLRLGAYVASKVTVLTPFLLVVIVGMLAILRQLNRLPDRPLSTYASMTVSLLLCAVAALALGLLTSAAVRNVAQATLALPMLCFPAVLFAGAVLPVHVMARAGAGISLAMPSRWTFEAIGHDLGARWILGHGGSPLGRPLLASFGDAGQASTVTYWLVLASFVVTFLAGTWAVLVRRTARATR